MDWSLVPCPEAVFIHGQDSGGLSDAATMDYEMESQQHVYLDK